MIRRVEIGADKPSAPALGAAAGTVLKRPRQQRQVADASGKL